MNTRAFAKPRGFTLVELLVVITIIGILAGLALVAIPGAVSRVKEGGITAEIAQMDSALKLFKNDYGAFPPDGNAPFLQAKGTTRPPEFNSFLNRLFPRRNRAGDLPLTQKQVQNMLDAGMINPDVVDATNSSTYPVLDNLGSTEAFVLFLMGMSSDAEYPLTGGGDRKRYFEFARERLVDAEGDGWYSYLPASSDAPYVYFCASRYGAIDAVGNPAADAFARSAGTGSGTGEARPYVELVGSGSTGRIQFVNKDSFQLICAGIDGNYGTFTSTPGTATAMATTTKLYPSGLGMSSGTHAGSIEPYTTEDRDNITNFAQGPLRNKEPE
ncbi:type II secretion system GspH family protein [Blastopirellula sp. JC732]|uniref:Type II secretion system GspH family protein n=1 Tax=Blastopirellula sediminis TaxID=2894196 RepID=A0A9X1MIW8_9BACT|nr:type II secretion system protein [Blastopirellula sediminis]MCC9609305.1 type II secretion system GspH family protein [Blastopirellula sediminis]MCC9627918.1 type II secretion system GspH family protein [Blastopirellula sediminis]